MEALVYEFFVICLVWGNHKELFAISDFFSPSTSVRIIEVFD